MPPGDLLVELRGVRKDYRALRPLRIERLELRAGRSTALLGFDQAMAEVLVDSVTAATMPDAGQVFVFGRPTTTIQDSEAWLKLLDRFGLLTERAVLMDQFTAEQNLVLPFTLDFEDIGDALRARVRALAREIGLEEDDLGRPAGALTAAARLRIRLGRALALDPPILLAEHPNATLSRDETAEFAADLSRIIAARGLAALVVTADRTFASAVSEDVLTLSPGSGKLERTAGWRRWFS